MVRIRFHYPTKLGEGNVFTGVSQFVCRGWVSLILCPFKGMGMPPPKGVGISRGVGYVWGGYVWWWVCAEGWGLGMSVHSK